VLFSLTFLFSFHPLRTSYLALSFVAFLAFYSMGYLNLMSYMFIKLTQFNSS
jgi:hypothetical protein